jgi:uncharacterized membrane protein YhaH (DUF805 family)
MVSLVILLALLFVIWMSIALTVQRDRDRLREENIRLCNWIEAQERPGEFGPHRSEKQARS